MTRTSAATLRQRLPSRRALATGLVALLVVLSGCSGILGDSTASPATDGANPGTDTGDATPTGGDTTSGAGTDGGADDPSATSGSTSNQAGSTSDGGGNADAGNTSQGGDATTSNGTSFRLAHMSPDAPALDVAIDNETVLTDVSVGAISAYVEVQPGTHFVRLTDAENPDSVAFADSYTFEDGTLTIKTVGEWTESGDAHIAPYPLPDNNTPAGPDTAKVRLVHTSPDAPAMDVTTAGNGRVLFDNVSLTQSTGYVDLSPGEYTLQIREETTGNDGSVLTTTNISVGGGGVYTAFAAGYLTPGDEPADMGFRIIGSVDNQPGDGDGSGGGDGVASNDSGA